MISWQPGIKLEDVEEQVILAALRFYSGNRTKAASSLGIAAKTMSNRLVKMKDKGLKVPPPEGYQHSDNLDRLNKSL